MKTPKTKPSLLFRLIVPVTLVFIMTILVLIACLFGNPEAPIPKWLNANGNHILFYELIAVIGLSGIAMAVDRYNTLRGVEEEPFQQTDAEVSSAKPSKQ